MRIIFSSLTRRVYNLSDLTSYFERFFDITSGHIKFTHATWKQNVNIHDALCQGGWPERFVAGFGMVPDTVIEEHKRTEYFFDLRTKKGPNFNSPTPPKVGKKERKLTKKKKKRLMIMLRITLVLWLPTRCWLLPYKPEITIFLQINHPVLFIFPLSHKS